MNQIFRLYIGMPKSYAYKAGRQAIIPILTNAGIEGFTIVNSIGIWQGKEENSLIITVVNTESDMDMIRNIYIAIKWIKQALKQNCILITIGEGKAELV